MTPKGRRRDRPAAAAAGGPEPEPESNTVPGDYEVGYKKPPQQHQFRPGQSGNPNGRPKGSKNFTTLIDQELDTKITIREGGRSKDLSKREVIVKQVVKKGVEGDHRVLQMLLKLYPPVGAGLQPTGGEPPSAEAPLEEDDRAILAAFIEMVREGTAEAIGSAAPFSSAKPPSVPNDDESGDAL